MRADEDFLAFDALNVYLDELEAALVAQDYDRARGLLALTVEGYSPTNGIDDLVWRSKNDTGKAEGTAKVVDFQPRQA